METTRLVDKFTGNILFWHVLESPYFLLDKIVFIQKDTVYPNPGCWESHYNLET